MGPGGGSLAGQGDKQTLLYRGILQGIGVSSKET